MVEKNNKKLSVRKQTELLQLNRSLLYRKNKSESDYNIMLMNMIDKHHLKYPCKGVIQMQDFLISNGLKVNIKRVRRLMRLMCIETIYPKKNLSKLGKTKYIHPYLLRNKQIKKANEVWAIDITYIPMKEGFMYLTAVIDWKSRYVLGYNLSNTLLKESQISLVSSLVKKYGKPEIINSDQGSQYTSNMWVEYMNKTGIKISMDGKGRATDNAIIERFFRAIKQECIYLYPTSCVIELRTQIKDYIKYYNNKRNHQGIGRKIPVELYKSINIKTPNYNILVV